MFVPIVEYPTESEEAIFTSKEIKILENLNRTVAAGTSLDAIMDQLFEDTRSIGSWDRLGLAFVEEDGQRLVARYARADYDRTFIQGGYTEDAQGSSLLPILEKGRMRIIHNLADYYEAHPGSRSTALLLKEGVRSSLTCGLRVDDRPVALLFLSSRDPRAFTSRDAALHQAITERLAQAVEKAYQIEQLQKANEAYVELLGFVSHELKSPLSSLISSGRLLTDGYLGELTANQQKRAERMVLQGEYLMSMVKEYLDLARIEDGSMLPSPQDIDFVEVVCNPAIEITRELAEQKQMKITCLFPEDAPTVTCDPELFKVVVVNLLSNAIKYGDEKGSIDLRYTVDSNEFMFSCKNTGPGFPLSARSKLFKKFSRLAKPELKRQKGTGVGLYSCWRIVQMHRGKIVADSSEGEWAEFRFRIPQTLEGYTQ